LEEGEMTIHGRDGNFYGTAESGGANTNCVQNGPGIPNGPGTVFRLSPPTSQQTQWSERVLWSFGASDDGVRPQASLLADN
jgi:hypothetical protein